MHHAWLISGEEGIGKASLAFRMVRFVLSHPDPASDAVISAKNLDIPADSPAAIKIAHGTHGNILHIQREWDEKNKRFKTGLTVDSVRRIIPFLGTTAGEGAWRIVIVDPADDMNRSAANALLKALEEPPSQTLFFLISAMPGRLLPTIRSRCRLVACRPLDEAGMRQVLGALEPGFEARDDAGLILALAHGSPRRALGLIREDGSELYRLLLRAFDTPDHANASAIADKAADQKSGGPARFIELLNGYLNRRVRGLGEPETRHTCRLLRGRSCGKRRRAPAAKLKSTTWMSGTMCSISWRPIQTRYGSEASPEPHSAEPESPMSTKPTYYLTTAISYPNGVPHIGHKRYFAARWHHLADGPQ